MIRFTPLRKSVAAAAPRRPPSGSARQPTQPASRSARRPASPLLPSSQAPARVSDTRRGLRAAGEAGKASRSAAPRLLASSGSCSASLSTLESEEEDEEEMEIEMDDGPDPEVSVVVVVAAFVTICARCASSYSRSSLDHRRPGGGSSWLLSSSPSPANASSAASLAGSSEGECRSGHSVGEGGRLSLLLSDTSCLQQQQPAGRKHGHCHGREHGHRHGREHRHPIVRRRRQREGWASHFGHTRGARPGQNRCTHTHT